MTAIPPQLSEPIAQSPVRAKRAKGFFAPKAVKAAAFYIIALCLVASVLAGILAIWHFAEPDTFWRMLSTFFVVAAGAAPFLLVNRIFGEEREG
ncbi:MAG: hypothetical protein EXS29_00945 [Pedosphaera sp.]|nr:hypothetical protein [Pedosphaera sp.]